MGERGDPTWAERTAPWRLGFVILALIGGGLWLWQGRPRVCVQEGAGDAAAVRTVCNVPGLTDPQLALPLSGLLLLLAPDLTEIGIGNVLTAKWRDTTRAAGAADLVGQRARPDVADPAAARLALAEAALRTLVVDAGEPWQWLAGYVRGGDEHTVFVVALTSSDGRDDPPRLVSEVVIRLLVDPRLPVLRAVADRRVYAATMSDADGMTVAAVPVRNAHGRVIGALAGLGFGRQTSTAAAYRLDALGGLWARILVDLLGLADDESDDGQGV
jgi:hypothetical protein